MTVIGAALGSSLDPIVQYTNVDKVYAITDVVAELDQALANPQATLAGDPLFDLNHLKAIRDTFNNIAQVVAAKALPLSLSCFIRDPSARQYGDHPLQYQYTVLSNKQKAYDKTGIKIWPPKP